MITMQPCGGCAQESYYSHRLLDGHRFDAPAPPVSAPSVDAQRAHLERALCATTIVLFVASLSYIAFSTLYGCLRGGRRRGGPGGDGDSGAEETKRALEEIPVQVVVQVRGGGGDREGGGVEDEASDCAVCLEEYAAGDEVRVLPACRHGFHRECVDRWLLMRAPTCPVCRAPVARVEGPDAKEDCAGGQGDVGHGGISGVSFAGSHVIPVAWP